MVKRELVVTLLLILSWAALAFGLVPTVLILGNSAFAAIEMELDSQDSSERPERRQTRSASREATKEVSGRDFLSGLYRKYARFSVKILSVVFTSSSYPLDANASRGRARIFHAFSRKPSHSRGSTVRGHTNRPPRLGGRPPDHALASHHAASPGSSAGCTPPGRESLLGESREHGSFQRPLETAR